MTLVFDLKLPQLPNFIRLGDEQSIDVAALSDAQLHELGQAWTVALIAHAQSRRERSEP